MWVRIMLFLIVIVVFMLRNGSIVCVVLFSSVICFLVYCVIGVWLKMFYLMFDFVSLISLSILGC